MNTTLEKVTTVKGSLQALDFETVSGKVYGQSGEVLKGYQRIWRPDTGATLAIMKEGYKLVQHKEPILPVVDALGREGWKVDASHLERHGARAYVQLSRLDKPIKVLGEKVGERILLRNSYDGSSSLTINIGAIVVSCLNGATILGKGGLAFNSHHTGDIYERLNDLTAKIRDIEEGLGKRMIDTYSQLDSKVPTDIAKQIVERVLGERKTEAAMKYWHSGIGRDGSRTAWNLYNGVTQYLTHDWTGNWGRRERKNAQAFEMIANYVKNGRLPAVEKVEEN